MEAEGTTGGREAATGGREVVAETKTVATKAVPVEAAEAANPKVKVVKVVGVLAILTNLLEKPAPCTGNTGNPVIFVVILMSVLGSTRPSRGRRTTNETGTSPEQN